MNIVTIVVLSRILNELLELFVPQLDAPHVRHVQIPRRIRRGNVAFETIPAVRDPWKAANP